MNFYTCWHLITWPDMTPTPTSSEVYTYCCWHDTVVLSKSQTFTSITVYKRLCSTLMELNCSMLYRICISVVTAQLGENFETTCIISMCDIIVY